MSFEVFPLNRSQTKLEPVIFLTDEVGVFAVFLGIPSHHGLSSRMMRVAILRIVMVM